MSRVYYEGFYRDNNLSVGTVIQFEGSRLQDLYPDGERRTMEQGLSGPVDECGCTGADAKYFIVNDESEKKLTKFTQWLVERNREA